MITSEHTSKNGHELKQWFKKNRTFLHDTPNMDIGQIRSKMMVIKGERYVSKWTTADFSKISVVNDKMDFIYNSFVHRSGEHSYLLEETTRLWFDMTVLSQTLTKSHITDGRSVRMSVVLSNALKESLNDLLTAKHQGNACLNISLSQLLIVRARLICSEILNGLLQLAISSGS